MHSVLGNGPRSLAVNAQDSCVSLLPDTQTVVFTDAHAIYAKGITLKHKKIESTVFCGYPFKASDEFECDEVIAITTSIVVTKWIVENVGIGKIVLNTLNNLCCQLSVGNLKSGSVNRRDCFVTPTAAVGRFCGRNRLWGHHLACRASVWQRWLVRQLSR